MNLGERFLQIDTKEPMHRVLPSCWIVLVCSGLCYWAISAIQQDCIDSMMANVTVCHFVTQSLRVSSGWYQLLLLNLLMSSQQVGHMVTWDTFGQCTTLSMLQSIGAGYFQGSDYCDWKLLSWWWKQPMCVLNLGEAIILQLKRETLYETPYEAFAQTRWWNIQDTYWYDCWVHPTVTLIVGQGQWLLSMLVPQMKSHITMCDW